MKRRGFGNVGSTDRVFVEIACAWRWGRSIAGLLARRLRSAGAKGIDRRVRQPFHDAGQNGASYDDDENSE